MNRSDFDKPRAWRESTISCITDSKLVSRGKLVASYMEMVGVSGLEMFTLMENILPSPEMFIGVEIDPVVLYRVRREALARKLGLQIVFGDFYRCCSVLAQKPNALYALPGVFVADETEQLAREGWWHKEWRMLAIAIESSIKSYGEAVVVLNSTIDRSVLSPSRHLREICDHFDRYCSAWRQLGPLIMDFSIVDDAAFGDRAPVWIGPFQVYKSEGRHLRMATLRVRFTQSTRKIYTEWRSR